MQIGTVLRLITRQEKKEEVFLLKRNRQRSLRAMALVLLLMLLSGCARTQGGMITDFADFDSPDMRLGIATGTQPHFLAEELFPSAQLVPYNSFVDALNAVKTGKADGFAFTSAILQEFVREDPDVTVMDGSYGSVLISAGLALGNTELCEKVNRQIAGLREDGTLADMEKRWIEDGATEMPELAKPEHTEGTLRILTEGVQKPFSFNAGGTYVGFDIELGARIAYSLGMDYRVITMSFGSLIPALNSGKGDIILCDLNETEERAREILFSDSYYTADVSILVRRDRYAPSAGTADSGAAASGTTLADKFRATFITESRWRLFVRGIGVTVLISVCAFVLASLWGAALVWLSRSRHRLCRGFAAVYCKLISGIPMLVWLMILYYIVFGRTELSGIFVAVIGLGLVSGAPLCGIFRTGLESVDSGQLEAAAALGFTPSEIFRRIILPRPHVISSICTQGSSSRSRNPPPLSATSPSRISQRFRTSCGAAPISPSSRSSPRRSSTSPSRSSSSPSCACCGAHSTPESAVRSCGASAGAMPDGSPPPLFFKDSISFGTGPYIGNPIPLRRRMGFFHAARPPL